MLTLRPNEPVIANNIAWILATAADETLRDVRRAIEMADELCRRTERRVYTTLDTLAAAYAAAGRFADAAHAAREAARLAEGQASTGIVNGIIKRLKQYEAAGGRAAN